MKRLLAILSVLSGIVMGHESLAAEKTDTLANIYGTVRGRLLHYNTESKLPRVSVLLVSGRDSSYTVTNGDGIFYFKDIPPGNIILRLSHTGKRTITEKYDIEAGANAFFFRMEDLPEELEEATVSAEAVLMRQIADTTVYNTAAVSYLPGEKLRAVLEQLPGFQADSKKLLIDGEEVKRTYVNGTLIFGDNPLTAIDALMADEVTQIKVFDEADVIDQRRGRKHGKKDRVLDIVTKEKMLSLSEITAAGAGGADETVQMRYAGAAAASYHSEMFGVGGMAYAENANPVSGGNGRISVISALGDVSVSDVPSVATDFGKLGSYSESYGIGAGAVKYWKDRKYGNSASFEYNYSHKFENGNSSTLREFFADGDNPAGKSADSSSSAAVTGRHYFITQFDLKDTPLKSVFLSLSGDIRNTGNSALDISETSTADSDNISRRHETSASDTRDYNVDAHLAWKNNDAVIMHPEVSVDFNMSDSNSSSWKTDTLATSSFRRQLSSDGFGRNTGLSARAGFENYLINDERRSLSLSYGLASGYGRTRSRQLTLDGFDVEIPVEDLANTYDYTWNSLDNNIFVSTEYNTENLLIKAKAGLHRITQTDDEAYPQEYSSRKNYWTVDSDIGIQYGKLNVNASLKSSIPSLEQSRNRISDTNPLALSGGNPELLPSYRLSLSVSYNNRFANGLGHVYGFLAGNCGFREIVSKTRYFDEETVLSEWDGYTAMAGSRLYTYENATVPSYSIRGAFRLTGFFLKRKLSVMGSPTFSFSSAPMFYGDRQVMTDDLNAGMILTLIYRPERHINLRVNNDANYVMSTGNRNSLLSERIIINTSVSGTVRFLRNMTAEMTYRMRDIDFLRGAGKDFSDHTLNASLSYEFCKGMLKVSAHCVNLLDSGSSFTEAVTAESSIQTWEKISGRYFMLSLVYSFRRK